MEAAPPTPSPSASPHSAQPSFWPWLFASLVFTVALSLAAAHSPPRIRLIGLFSIAFGLLVGWVLRTLAKQLDAAISRRSIGLWSALFTIGGLIGGTSEIVRIEAAKQSKSPHDITAQRLIEQMEDTPKATNAIDSQSTRLDEFRRHLAQRIRQLGAWSSPWPEVFWLTEILVAATASFWIASRLAVTAVTILGE